MNALVKVLTNILVVAIAAFGAAYATGIGGKASLGAALAAVVGNLTGLFQKAPGA